MDDKSAAVQAKKKIVVEVLRKHRPIERCGRKRQASERIEKNLCTGLVAKEAWLAVLYEDLAAKTGLPLLAGKQVGFEKDEKICQHSWSKWMITMIQLKSLFINFCSRKS